jgi:hypothetical protein
MLVSHAAIRFQLALFWSTNSRPSAPIDSPGSHQPSAFALRARLNQVDSFSRAPSAFGLALPWSIPSGLPTLDRVTRH